MSVALQSVSLLNPDPSSCGLKKSPSCSSLRFGQFLAARGNGASPIAVWKPKVLSGASLSLHRRSLWTRPIVAVSASQEESHSDIEVEDENSNAKPKSEESEEARKQTLGSFREQTLKMHSITREFSNKALVIMKDTSEQLKIHADKARDDLSEIAISIAEENSPEPVQEIVKTFHLLAFGPNDVVEIHDFHVGIPYGLLLSVGGFLSFLVTGSISAIRFGVILGATLLFLSVSSLRSYKEGESSPFVLKLQTAISGIIFLRELIFLAQSSSLPNILTTLVSGAVVAFYFNKIAQNRKRRKGSNLEKETES